MQEIEVNIHRCVGCAYCLIVCPVESFRVEGVSHFLQKCNKCGLCVLSCPVSAIKSNWEE